jgi:transposase
LLKLLDTAYPADTAIEVILDNHSAHVSKETAAWLAVQPVGRFTFTFTPKHGSWLNIIEFLKTRTQGAPDGLHRRH